MITRDQAINCIHRVRRMEELKRQAEAIDEVPADYQLLVLMLRQLRQRERLLMAQLTPEERLDVREEIERQDRLSRLAGRRGEKGPTDD